MKQNFTDTIDACHEAVYKVLDEAYPEKGQAERFVILAALAKIFFASVFLGTSKDKSAELRAQFLESVDKFILTEGD